MSDYLKHLTTPCRKKAPTQSEPLGVSLPLEVAVAQSQLHYAVFYIQASLSLRGSQFNTITPFKEHLKA